MNEALRDWVTNVDDTFYIIGTVAGPHPYPAMVRDFQSVIGNETRAQIAEAEGRLPDTLVACIGGGSNAIGLFHPFLDDPTVADDRRRGGGPRASRPACTPPRSPAGGPASCTATAPICCRTTTARSSRRIRSRPASTIPASARSMPGCTISAASNMSRPPTTRRSTPSSCCAELEGIIPALEPAHALAHVAQIAPQAAARTI